MQGRRKAASPLGLPKGPEVRTRLPRWARDHSQHPGAGTRQASRLSWKVRQAFASRGGEGSRLPRVGSKEAAPG